MRLILILVLWAVTAGACWAEPEWTELRRGFSDCIIIVFEDGTTVEEVNAFMEQHLEGPPHPGGGKTLRPGVGAVLNTKVDGQDALEICFRTESGSHTRRALQSDVKLLPIVDEVLERPRIKQQSPAPGKKRRLN